MNEGEGHRKDRKGEAYDIREAELCRVTLVLKVCDTGCFRNQIELRDHDCTMTVA